MVCAFCINVRSSQTKSLTEHFEGGFGHDLRHDPAKMEFISVQLAGALLRFVCCYLREH